jgi:hypothetical protein
MTVTVAQIIRACGLVALNSAIALGGTMSPIAMSFRVKRVRVWSSVNGLGNTTQSSTGIATVSLDFDVDSVNGGNPGLQITDTTMTPDRCAFIDVVPPANSYARFWHSQVESAQALFIVNCALGSIMDLHVEWVLNDSDGFAGVGLTQNTIAQTQGLVYYPLLAQPAGAPVWTPIGRVASGNA